MASVSDFDVSSAPPWRLRLQVVLAWFGLVHDPREEAPTDETARARETRPKPEWTRILFAVAIPLWASDRLEGGWYATFVALAGVSGVIELVRWTTRSYDRGRLDTLAGLLQLWAMFGLLMFVVFGDEIGGGTALAYAAACSAAFFGLVGAGIWWGGRDERPAAGGG